MSDTPIGLRSVFEDFKRYPDDRARMHERAVLEREALLSTYRASRARFGWHPFQTIKSILLSATITFVIAWLVSSIAMFGKWYINLRSNKIDVTMPFLGNQKMDIGSLIPLAPGVEQIGKIPNFGIREAAYLAGAIAAIIFVERVLLTFFNMKQIRILKRAEKEVKKELAALTELGLT